MESKKNKLVTKDEEGAVEVESHDTNGKKPHKEQRSLTDEEYEEIFAAVLAVTQDPPKETKKSPEINVNEDDFDALLHEEVAASEAEDKVEEAEEKVEGEEEENDDNELNLDELPQDVRADVLQMTNELTPCTSDVEDNVNHELPMLPPMMMHKKHGSASKKQCMKPKQLKFNKNRNNVCFNDSEDTSKKSARDGNIADYAKKSHKEYSERKIVKTGGDIPFKCRQSEIVHKKNNKTDITTDICKNKRSSDESHIHKKTNGKAKKRTIDSVIRSQEANNIGNSKHRHSKHRTKKVSKKQKMQKRQLEETGTWVQCTSTFCMKWRYLPHVHDPSSLPDDWVCHMNTDEKYNSCEVPQQQFDQQEHDQNYVFTTYTEGSVVWARIDGYPWWPAMVEIDPDYEDFYECRGPRNKATHYHVVFFDDKVSRAWLATDKLRPFGDIDEPNMMVVRGINHSKWVNSAKCKALQALDMPLKDRVQHYSFSVRYSGKWGINIIDDDSHNSQLSSSSSCPATFVQKESLPTFELTDDDVEDMLNNAEEIMMDAEEILEFFPSDNEEVMSDYEPEKPKKMKEKKKKKIKKNARNEDTSSIKTKTKRMLNEDGSDKKYKKRKSSTDKLSTGSKEKKKVKLSGGADASKVKPSFQPPKQEKVFKVKKVKPAAPKLDLDSKVSTMEMSCDIAGPKKSNDIVKKSVTKNYVTSNDKENIDTSSTTKHLSNLPKLASQKEKTLAKTKVAVKPKFVAPNVHKLTKTEGIDNTSVVTKDKDQLSGVAKKKFSIKKTPVKEKSIENKNDKTNNLSEKQESVGKSDPKKTKGAKNLSTNLEKTLLKDTTNSLSPRQSVDDISNDLSVDIEDKLFPDLELPTTSMERRPGEDDDSEPFDVEPEDVTVISGADKLNRLNAAFDSDPMEFEE